jgi:hypothetical protein
VATRAFDPEQPIARPVQTVLPWARMVPADELLRAGSALDSLPLDGSDELFVDFDTLGPAGDARAEALAQLLERLRGRGLRVHGSFTLGQDHDDVGCFERLVEWIEARRLASVELRLWTPDPGCAVVRALMIADRIRHRDLQRWDGQHVVVNPAQMSAQTLYRGWAWARRRLGSLRSIWRRRPCELAALPAYLLAMTWPGRPGEPVVILPSGPATLQA